MSATQDPSSTQVSQFDLETLPGQGGIGEAAGAYWERIKGGDLDLEKAAMTLLTDYRAGSLGRISLETPETRREMMSAAQPAPPAEPAETPEADE